MKLKGIAKATAMAWAGSSERSPTEIRSSSAIRLMPQREDADGEEAGRLEAGVAVPRVEGPVAVPEEVVADRDAEGEDRRRDVVDAEAVAALAEEEALAGEQGEDGQVDDVAREAHHPELEELAPVAGLHRPAADPLGGLHGRHGIHFLRPTPKCSSTTGARSRSAHGRLPGLRGPHPTISSGASESSRLSAPWLPPPTWVTPPQSTHSYPSAAEIRRSPACGEVSADHSRVSPSGYSSLSKRPPVMSACSASGSPSTCHRSPRSSASCPPGLKRSSSPLRATTASELAVGVEADPVAHQRLAVGAREPGDQVDAVHAAQLAPERLVRGALAGARSRAGTRRPPGRWG